jgi:hypothetical protein
MVLDVSMYLRTKIVWMLSRALQQSEVNRSLRYKINIVYHVWYCDFAICNVHHQVSILWKVFLAIESGPKHVDEVKPWDQECRDQNQVDDSPRCSKCYCPLQGILIRFLKVQLLLLDGLIARYNYIKKKLRLLRLLLLRQQRGLLAFLLVNLGSIFLVVWIIRTTSFLN